MEARFPNPDWSEDRRWRWPCWKFGMGLDELFTTLHDQFNTWPAPIQTFEAFHSDVTEMSSIANTREEFFRALEARKKQRTEEMAQAWDSINVHLAAGQSVLPDEQWGLACEFFGSRALDSMLAFLFSFLTPEEKILVWNYINGPGKRGMPTIGGEGVRANEGQADLEGVQADAATSSQGEQASQGPTAGAHDGEDQAHVTESSTPADSIRPSSRQPEERSPEEEVAPKTTRRRHKSNDRVSKPGPRRSQRVKTKERSTKESTTTRSRYNLRSNASRRAG